MDVEPNARRGVGVETGRGRTLYRRDAPKIATITPAPVEKNGYASRMSTHHTRARVDIYTCARVKVRSAPYSPCVVFCRARTHLDYPLRITGRKRVHIRCGYDDAAEEDAKRGPEAHVWPADGVVQNACLGRIGRDKGRVRREE